MTASAYGASGNGHGQAAHKPVLVPYSEQTDHDRADTGSADFFQSVVVSVLAASGVAMNRQPTILAACSGLSSPPFWPGERPYFLIKSSMAKTSEPRCAAWDALRAAGGSWADGSEFY